MASQMANAKFERTSITIKAIDNLGQNNLFEHPANIDWRLGIKFFLMINQMMVRKKI